VWGIDNYNEYLKGSSFTPYVDPKPFEPMENQWIKTFNWLQIALLEHNFITLNRQTSELPNHFKQPPNLRISSARKSNNELDEQTQPQLPEFEIPEQNYWIHADIFDPVPIENNLPILSITDACTKYTVIEAISNNDAPSIAQALD
jgi:hypothetical protein